MVSLGAAAEKLGAVQTMRCVNMCLYAACIWWITIGVYVCVMCVYEGLTDPKLFLMLLAKKRKGQLNLSVGTVAH